MKVTRRPKQASSNLSSEQVEVLKSVGRIRVSELKNITEYLPENPDEPMWQWVFNKSNAVLVLGDLDFNVAAKEIVWLPKFFDTSTINSSVGIRNAVMILKTLIAIKDPTALSAEDIKVEKPIIEQLGRGEHDAENVLSERDENYENPHIEGLIEYEEKEKKIFESMAAGAKVGEQRRRSPKKKKKSEEEE